MLATLDSDQFGQAVIGLCIFLGFVAQQWQARKRANEVKRQAEETAREVAATAIKAAEAVEEHVVASKEEQQKTLQEIHILVNNRLDQLLAQLDTSERRNLELETKLGLAAGAEVPTSQILTGPAAAQPANHETEAEDAPPHTLDP